MSLNRKNVGVVARRAGAPMMKASVVAALAASAGLASPVSADVWSWNAGNGLWSNAANWAPSSVPSNLAGEVIVRIGDLAGVSNSTVLIDFAGWLGTTLVVDELHMSDGMTLDTNGQEFAVYRSNGLASATMTGANTRWLIRPAAESFGGFDGYTESLTMGAGTQLQIVDNASMWLGDTTSSGIISGRGSVRYAGLLRNDGTIAGTNNGGLTLEYNSFLSILDLDGSTGDGQLALASPFSQLTVNGDELADSFGGTVTMGSGSLLTMNLSAGWTADASSTINVASSIVGAAAAIDGGHFTFGGDLNIGGSQGHLRVLADATFNSSADVFLGTDDRLEFDGTTVIEGGVYELSDGARVDFDGPTEISGGTFNMVGDTVSQGVVNLNGPTVWTGNIVTINGVARQLGNASVSTPTTINAGVLDMDGNNSTFWTINNALTVNTDAIELGSQQFDGTFNLNVGAIGRLTVNLADTGASWTMSGTMNLAGLGILTTTRVAGSRMIVTGDLNMGAGIAQITADTAFQNANVLIEHNGTLRMRGNTSVDASTAFSNSGVLENGVGGSMLLHSGASLGAVGLTNNNVLRIGESGPGIASVDRFASTINAAWGVDIGGYAPGTEHDLLLVTGGAADLGGTLNVSLIGLGAGAVFAPSVGDEFTILSALGGVSGTFSNDPVSLSAGLTYEWSIIYNPNTVVLRLDRIVPTPGSAVLLGLSGLLAAKRRRV
ncbi:MAG: hypothetical protein ACKVZJ_04940 [Phycisphaerales bacterium]